MAVKARRTSPEIFMDKLEQLSTKNGKNPISSRVLRDALKWNDAKFNTIRAELMQLGRIEKGEGYGTISLNGLTKPKALKVFISYAHEDTVLKDELLKHLEPLRRLGLISSWDDKEVTAGEEWKKEIDYQLEHADIVMLLISIDFINSAYCNDELRRALERRKEKKTSVIPVILRSCAWKYDFLQELQALPEEGKPVSTMDRDEALTQVAEGIQKVVQKMTNSK